MHRSITILFIVMTWYATCNASDNADNVKPKKKTFMEGSLRLSFGEKVRLGISPTINYQISNSLSVGMGLIAEYYSNHDSSNVRFNTGIFGTNIVANYEVKRISEWLNERTSAYLYFEHELLSLENKYFEESQSNGRSWTNASFLGFKIKRKIGFKERFALSLIVAYNLNNNDVTSMIYNNPQVKLGFQF